MCRAGRSRRLRPPSFLCFRQLSLELNSRLLESPRRGLPVLEWAGPGAGRLDQRVGQVGEERGFDANEVVADAVAELDEGGGPAATKLWRSDYPPRNAAIRRGLV
jgi:hypothetical protein